MEEKGNKVENWNESYERLPTTYSEDLSTPANIVNTIQNEFVLEDIQRLVADPARGSFLECGCGGARTSLYLALRGLNVTCSDYAPGAVRLAKDNFAALNAEGTFLQDDLLNSKITPESFDCVMSFGLLEHFEDPGRHHPPGEAWRHPDPLHHPEEVLDGHDHERADVPPAPRDERPEGQMGRDRYEELQGLPALREFVHGGRILQGLRAIWERGLALRSRRDPVPVAQYPAGRRRRDRSHRP
jgi:SAM-dependent methyltransferase